MIDLSEVRHIAEQYSTAPIVKVLSRTGITPNTLTFVGFLVSVAAGAVIAKELLLLVLKSSVLHQKSPDI